MLRMFVCIFFVCGEFGCAPPEKFVPKQVVGAKVYESIPDLLKLLPNLKSLKPESCAFERIAATKKSDLPSPSDTTIKVIGWIQMEKSDLDQFRSEDRWNALNPKAIPSDLKNRLPGGRWLVSTKWNRSFNTNPTMAHGILLLPEASEEKRVWIYSQDMDHPIDLQPK